jgi:hypothetical protein
MGHQVVESPIGDILVHVFDSDTGADRNVLIKIFDENPSRFDKAMIPWI